MYYVYFIKSERNGKIYTGMSEKFPEERLQENNSGANVFSRQNKPFSLLYYEKYFCKEDAAQRERFYKTGFGRSIRNAIIDAVSAIGGSAFGGG